MRALSNCRIPFYSRNGQLVAHVLLTPVRDATTPEIAPLVRIDDDEARQHGETPLQLRETERYEYEVEPIYEGDLRLRCRLATRRKSLQPGSRDAGMIDTGSYCGTLLLELIEGDTFTDRQALASAQLDVRSVKLEFRTQYRGMLRRITDVMIGLVADTRSAATVRFRSSFTERSEAGWLQLQLELLREVLDSDELESALYRVRSFPSERMTGRVETVQTDRPMRWTGAAVRQLSMPGPRRPLPTHHPARLTPGIDTVVASVSVARRESDLDTPENRFVKFVLTEFQAFLNHAERAFSATPGWDSSAALARRLASVLEVHLGNAFFRQLGPLQYAPLGSPVLQRRAGYRDVFRLWIRFNTAAELSWDGGEDVFRAGQRDAATLYEYWLFFELLDWFCRTCRDGVWPAPDQLIEGLDGSSPNLRLRKRVELGPIPGVFAGVGRRLNARFSYNRRFSAVEDRQRPGSWTRGLRPDYTLTFWPESFSEEEAERREMLVHVHFDAKYRVENEGDIFGSEDSEATEDDASPNYKRQDLLKMHAYRDAIRRTHGAYVLYPGRARRPVTFRGYHEILPGLGAFSVTPDEHGRASGFRELDTFLGAVVSHLSNRTTALERLRYHISEAYGAFDAPVTHPELWLPESDDLYGPQVPALPLAEHVVLVAWYRTEAQLRLAASQDGLVFVRLGRRAGALHVHPNLSRTRHVLLRSNDENVAPGLLRLREPGFRVYTRSQLRTELKSRIGVTGVAAWENSAEPGDEEQIYALFKTQQDTAFQGIVWNGSALMDLIEAFEAEARNRPLVNLGRMSPCPRLISLRDLLKVGDSSSWPTSSTERSDQR